MSTDAETRRLLYIRETLTLIEGQAHAGYESLLADPTERDALLWRLYTVADSAHELSAELKARRPEIPWERVRGFRNIAAHGYLSIAFDAAWDIVEHHLATLKAVVERELHDRGHPAGPA